MGGGGVGLRAGREGSKPPSGGGCTWGVCVCACEVGVIKRRRVD